MLEKLSADITTVMLTKHVLDMIDDVRQLGNSANYHRRIQHTKDRTRSLPPQRYEKIPKVQKVKRLLKHPIDLSFFVVAIFTIIQIEPRLYIEEQTFSDQCLSSEH